VFPLTDVQTYMGHKSVETTRRYIHHVPGRDADAKLTALVSQDTGYQLGTEIRESSVHHGTQEHPKAA
jgi:hypothetical protein